MRIVGTGFWGCQGDEEADMRQEARGNELIILFLAYQ